MKTAACAAFAVAAASARVASGSLRSLEDIRPQDCTTASGCNACLSMGGCAFSVNECFNGCIDAPTDTSCWSVADFDNLSAGEVCAKAETERESEVRCAQGKNCEACTAITKSDDSACLWIGDSTGGSCTSECGMLSPDDCSATCDAEPCDAGVCCESMDATCQACSECKTVEEFCSEKSNADVQGCTATDFYSCVQNGMPVQESSPEKCVSGGETFINDDPCMSCEEFEGSWSCMAMACQPVGCDDEWCVQCPDNEPFVFVDEGACCESCHATAKKVAATDFASCVANGNQVMESSWSDPTMESSPEQCYDTLANETFTNTDPCWLAMCPAVVVECSTAAKPFKYVAAGACCEACHATARAKKVAATDFASCVANGNPVMEIFPAECYDELADKTFTDGLVGVGSGSNSAPAAATALLSVLLASTPALLRG